MGISNGSRKLVGIALFVFWAAVTAILAAGLVFYQNNNNILNNSDSVAGSFLPKSDIKEITLDFQEIAKHNAASDCWMAIDGKVYNFTSYVSMHPGGAVPMLPYCGKDGTSGFTAKDQNNPKPHSDYARTLFASYYLGDLNQKIASAPQQQTLPIAANADIKLSSAAPASSSGSVPSSLPPGGNTTKVTLGSQEIIKHNTIKDCWLIIGAKVYNVTNYLGSHPGGTGAISPYCGKDATSAFAGLPHSSYAAGLLANYYIGNLNQTAIATQIQQNIQTTNQAVPPPPARGRDEEDDD